MQLQKIIEKVYNRPLSNKKMKYNFKPIISKVISILEKQGFYVEHMRGDHIKLNRNPPLKRPIILVNVKQPSNIVRQNLIRNCREAGINEEILKELNELLRY